MTDHSAPIFFVLGIPGQLHTAPATGRELNLPVVGIIANARTQEMLTLELRKNFFAIRSLPDHYLERLPAYEKMSLAELNAAQEKLEKSLGIENATLDTHRDRAIRWNKDFRAIRHWQLANMEFLDALFREFTPSFCMDGVSHYLQMTMRHVCRDKDIPYLLTANSRLSGFVDVLHEKTGHLVGNYEIFEELQRGNTGFVDAETLACADEAFYKFQDKPSRPLYALKNTEAGFNLKKIKAKLAYTLSPERLFPPERVRKVDRHLNYESMPHHSLWRGIRSYLRRAEQKLFKFFDDAPDLEAPYVYLPLHYAPENSDMFFGMEYDHHAGFVSQLAKHVPSGMQLYVKEHPTMLGRRPNSFYRELAALYNVKLVSPSIDTFTLIRHASIVATVTGTAGWEGYILGKPVIALGDVFYNKFPGILHARLDKDFRSKLDTYLANFKSDPAVRLNAYRAFYASCYKGTKGDIGPDITADMATENARNYARNIRQCIFKWGHTMEGKFPDNLVSETQSEKKTASL